MTIYWRQPGLSADYGIDRGGALAGACGAVRDWSIHPAGPGGLATGLIGTPMRADPWGGLMLREARR